MTAPYLRIFYVHSRSERITTTILGPGVSIGRFVDYYACITYTPFMGTTTIRVDTDTHAQLVELSNLAGDSLMATVRDAAEALRRQRFARQVAEELSRLRDDPEAWPDYLAETDVTSVADGLD